MTPAGHAAEAERLLDQARDVQDPASKSILLQAAQVHATLSLRELSTLLPYVPGEDGDQPVRDDDNVGFSDTPGMDWDIIRHRPSDVPRDEPGDYPGDDG